MDWNRIEQKIDTLMDHLIEIKVDISAMKGDIEANKDSLVEHVKRTNLLEEEIQRQEIQLQEAMKPIEWVRTTARVMAWGIPIMSAITGAIYYLITIWRH